MARDLHGGLLRHERHEAGPDLHHGGAGFGVEGDGLAALRRQAQVHPEAQAPFAEHRRPPAADDAERIGLVVGEGERGAGMGEVEVEGGRGEVVPAEADTLARGKQRRGVAAARIGQGRQPHAERQEHHFGRASRPGGPGAFGGDRGVSQHGGDFRKRGTGRGLPRRRAQARSTTVWAGDQARRTAAPGSSAGASRLWQKHFTAAPSRVPSRKVEVAPA